MNQLLYTFDHDLFLWLNFDGGAVIDAVMKAISTPYTWSWLYIVIIYILWQRYGWRRLLIFIVMVAVAVALADMIAGIFKHSGLLKNLWPSFPARLRPMHTPELQEVIHKTVGGGRYGTVSAHAGTMVALAIVSIYAMARQWFSYVMVITVLLICYSRIYLACHFPFDILLGTLVGAVSGIIGLFGYKALCLRFDKR